MTTCETLVGTYSLSPFLEEVCDLGLVFPGSKGEADEPDSISDEIDKADLRRFRLPKSKVVSKQLTRTCRAVLQYILSRLICRR